MSNTSNDIQFVSSDALIEDLLGIGSSALSALQPSGAHRNSRALLGLKAFMRRTLQLALQLGEDKRAVIHLESGETPATALSVGGWPDNRAANLGILFAWALAREPRWFAGLPFLALEPAQGGAEDASLRPDPRLDGTSTDELIRALTKTPALKSGVDRTSSERYPVSISAIVRQMLRIDPELLSARFRDHQADKAGAFAANPDARTRVGLEHVVLDAILQYGVMRRRNVDRIRLANEADAEISGRPSARIANLVTLLAAALHADDDHVVMFEAPRPRPLEEGELLRAAARLVYLDYSAEAMTGLELLCDRNIHFGWSDGFSRAERLLHSVGREIDPNGKRMPFIVAAQEDGFDAFVKK